MWPHVNNEDFKHYIYTSAFFFNHVSYPAPSLYILSITPRVL